MNVFTKWTFDDKSGSILRKEAGLYHQMHSLQDKAIPVHMGYYELRENGNFKFGLSMFKLYDDLPDLAKRPSLRCVYY